ncbi:tail protein X [Pseudomonas entomophila]|uniref:tail protein X n=1 Tax=Pseudomonas entomophila TaxID=312306 RepID=UPI003EBFD9FF
MADSIRTQQHDTVDTLCWRHYGSTQGLVEAVLAANSGLAEHGPFLPAGLRVDLPTVRTAAPERPMVNLWT